MTEESSKRNQLWAFLVLGVVVLMSVWYYLSNPIYIYIVVYLWFGFAYGFCQQYGRFCFASAWRDLILMRVTRMFVGLMIGVMAYSLISAYLQAINMHTYHPSPIGLHELVGGTLFGFGMVLAGGCATGSLYKTGEGNLSSFVVVMALVFSQPIFVGLKVLGGSSIFDTIFNGYIRYQPVYLVSNSFRQYGAYRFFIGDAFINTISIATILLVITYLGYTRKDIITQRTQATDGGSVKLSFREELSGFWSMITASKRTSIAAIVIAILAALQIYVTRGLRNKFGFDNFGQALNQLGFVNEPSSYMRVFDPGYWYITTQEAQFGAWLIEKVGYSMRDNVFFGINHGVPAPWHNPPLLLSIGLILGSGTMALLSNEFKWKIPNKELFTFAAVGGTFMGVGARTALGCNIGGFYTRVPFGNPGGWIFFVGMGVGAFGAAKVFNWWTARKMSKEIEIELE